MYTNNDFRLYHSAKGSSWKNHKYVSKSTSGGKAVYKYSSDPLGLKKKEELDEETQKLEEYKSNYEFDKRGADLSYNKARELDENGIPLDGPARDLLLKNAGNRYGSLYDYKDHGPYTQGTKDLSEQANLVAKLRNEYSQTPLGKADKFIESGTRAFDNAVKSFGDSSKKLMENPIARGLIRKILF